MSQQPTVMQGNTRLTEVDALRGVAALAVVLFHYTSQFAALYPDALEHVAASVAQHTG